ncbi:DJ-1/PfpI family protein [Lewinella sp. W8]|uniref:DJ-1/PfpI family protein n=1 Tax=Lewinella sp. W8 TaxID=2528208 RepID=UPI0010679547|nr:DJ-1/PfpI family protein [Lewinella sp. W8]MTB53726.1 DJ-1/PfpI family protein [Lewinella sp. W8]
MQACFILFDDYTLLDFVGAYDPLTRLRSRGHLPDFSWTTAAVTPTVRDGFGLPVTVDWVRPDLGAFDLIFIPGGYGTRSLREDHDFIAWLKTAAPVPLKTSVCTGSLLLGAAGFLRGLRATTHFNEYALLAPYCGEVLRERIVDEGSVVTAGAVAASLDLGLHLCERLAGPSARQDIQQSMHYPAPN